MRDRMRKEERRVAKGALAATIALLAGAGGVAAQSPADLEARANVAMQACAAASEREDEDVARPAADLAERLYRELTVVPGRAADGMTGQAQVLSRCRI